MEDYFFSSIGIRLFPLLFVLLVFLVWLIYHFKEKSESIPVSPEAIPFSQFKTWMQEHPDFANGKKAVGLRDILIDLQTISLEKPNTEKNCVSSGEIITILRLHLGHEFAEKIGHDLEFDLVENGDSLYYK